MKRILRTLSITMALALALTAIPTIMPQNSKNNIVEAATKKSSVKYTLKKGVLTVYGKGDMPKSMTFKNNKSIKKVIIKKGVKSISDKAFKGCYKLKKVKIPNTVTVIGKSSFEGTGIKKITIPKSVKEIKNWAFVECDKLKSVKMPGSIKISGASIYENEIIILGEKLKKIEFTTDLDINILCALNGTHWVVSKKDPNYKSIDGIIYTKDGKELVRVPNFRKKLEVADGCTTFCLQSILYPQHIEGKTCYTKCSVEEIILPKSVTTIESEKHKDSWMADRFIVPLKKIVVENPQIDAESIKELLYYVKKTVEPIIDERDEWIGNPLQICNFTTERVKWIDDLLTIDNEIVIAYRGTKTDADIAIKDGIKNIGYDVFDGIEINSIKLPEGLLKIDDRAFNKVRFKSPVVFPQSLVEIGTNAFAGSYMNGLTLPNNLKVIEYGAFTGTRGFSDVIIPDSVAKYEEYIFAGSGLKSIVLPTGTTEIPEGMFYGSDIKTINDLPNLMRIGAYAFGSTKIDVQEFLKRKTITTVEEGAFEHTEWCELTIPANISEVGANAFTSYLGEYNLRKNIVVEGEASKFAIDAFGKYTDVAITFKNGTKFSFGIVQATATRRKKTKVKIKLAKIKEIDGYEVVISTDKNFKKNVKTKNFDADTIELSFKVKKDSKRIYVKSRAYKIENGVKVYGRWCVGKTIVYK